ncbi:energy-coupling factor transporter transmembrane protein EcfT [Ktedonosporobacter rubrisoli]|uniref:Energy-coupling factor transporter transmembrane protein EcfT n=1 Tax=Ktedonosporobacter rubrisoli TaxID=2509675 RepID=A0A4P6JRC7_KTERU|nr:energy-coupling factor transporter transmembrane component T [Ktedonosporobacter rubrisoli]QBD77884.1 energy-coupling factor transporter transmembrane protein EcfT [Ktedonosporobacter rubrisoli]
MMRPIYYATDSALHRLNPLSKAIAIMPLLIFLAFATTIWVHLIIIIMHLLVLLAFGRIPPRQLARVLAPLLITLVGFFVLYSPFVVSDLAARSPLLFALGPIEIHLAGVLLSLATCLRLLAFYSVTLIFMLTTDATDLVRALVQQWHVDYRIGYAVMIAYRFIPLLAQELKLIRVAQKVRGVTDQRGVRAEIERTRRAFLPLFAGMMRSAERKAMAMDARAFGAYATRTYYRRLSLKCNDLLMPPFYWLACALIIALALWFGLSLL